MPRRGVPRHRLDASLDKRLRLGALGYRTRLRGTAGDQAVRGATALARREPDSDEIAQVRYCPTQGLLDAGRRMDRGPRPPAHLYVFAWHGKERAAVADHRAPDQWRFFVVPTHRLPDRQDSIGLPGLKLLTDDVGYEALRFTVDGAVASLRLRSTGT